MDHLEQLRHQFRTYLFWIILTENALIIGVYYGLAHYTALNGMIVLAIAMGVALGLTGLVMSFIGRAALQPLQAVWQGILQLNGTEQAEATATVPKVENLRRGRELVTSLLAQVYQLATVADRTNSEVHRQMIDLTHNFIAQNLPLPLVVLDASETIRFTNPAAAEYLGFESADMLGKNVYMVLDMSFPSEATFDTWLKAAKTQNATAATSWERVRLNVRDSHPARLFDLAAYYNRDNPDGNETMLLLFDHTKKYSQDDQAVSFIALSVHELRTPLTLLRGYIEVFEEEIGATIKDPELRDFLLKMHTQAEQLTAFVNNMLNVARVEDDQLELKLQPEDWSTVLKSSITIMSLRAKVRGITLQGRIATDLPPVGVDRLSISEVISNLIDNAIKYTGTSKVIKIETYLNADGYIETTVQDFGLGIAPAILPNLFTKFYRDHRHRAQVGGTGLGLYLAKAIVTAHGGSIWVKSKENEGSTFGFTLIPYAQLTEAMKQKGDQNITRGAHGWIKNHSLYRQ